MQSYSIRIGLSLKKTPHTDDREILRGLNNCCPPAALWYLCSTQRKPQEAPLPAQNVKENHITVQVNHYHEQANN